jgi:hypothetical protein
MTSFTFINDLEILKDEIDTIEPDNEPSIFTEESTLDLVETILHMMN